MLTFEKVLGIFADYLDADETTEVYISRHGCVRVAFGSFAIGMGFSKNFIFYLGLMAVSYTHLT